MGKHSPWHLQVDEAADYLDGISTDLVIREGDEVVAYPFEIDRALLIAAAPELLEALETFVAQWNACGPNSNFGRYFKNTRDAALVAIAKAKATGEDQ